MSRVNWLGDFAGIAENVAAHRKLGHVHTFRARLEFRKILPDLLTRETHDGRQQTNQRFADSPYGRLRRAARWRPSPKGVEAVFENIEIERAQIHDAEIVDPLVDLVEGELVIPAANVGRKGTSLTQHVVVERFHVVERNRVSLGIETVKISQDVAKRIAYLAVIFCGGLHQPLGADNVLAEIDRCHP